MSQQLRFVVFTLDEGRFALPLEAVERIVRAVAVTTLPKAPTIVLGIINVQGEIIPVINLRWRNNLPARSLGPDDEFIIARHSLADASERAVALWVDAVEGVLECRSDEVLPAAQLYSGVEYITGAIKREGRIILIQDLEQSLSASEAATLDAALTQNDETASDLVSNDVLAPACEGGAP
jgi:purine-binding chemotaxis protein CheW